MWSGSVYTVSRASRVRAVGARDINTTRWWEFNANKSNSKYTDLDKVHPLSLEVLMCIKYA